MSREEGLKAPSRLWRFQEASMSEAVKETKAQRVERLKRELNPWEAYADIQRFAREGGDAVPPEWLGTYVRWWGIYTQADCGGAGCGEGAHGQARPALTAPIRAA